MKKALLFLAICLSIGMHAQVKFEKHYGGSGLDFGFSATKTTDGGFVIAGYTQSFGAGSSDVYLIKTDANGDTLWTRTFGGSQDEYGFSVNQTADSGFIVAGYTLTTGNGWQVYLIKTDAGGNLSWDKEIGGTGNDFGFYADQVSDGGYIIGGATEGFGNGSSDAYLIKTDSTGNIVWTGAYGTGNDEKVFSVHETSDGNYIAGGFTRPNDGTGQGADIYMIKTNGSGDLTWSKTMGEAPNDFGYSIRETSDNNYILTGYSQSFGSGDYNVFIAKTDPSGASLWTKLYDANDDQVAFSIEETSANGFVVAGSSAATSFFFTTDNIGNVNWAKLRPGGFEDAAYYATETTAGRFAVAGYTAGSGSYPLGSYDVFLTRTDSAGNTGCNDNNISLAASSVTFTESLFIPDSNYIAHSGGTGQTFAGTSGAGGNVLNVCPGISVQEIAGPDIVCPNSSNIVYSITDTSATSFYWGVSDHMTITAGQGTDSIIVDTDSSFTGGSISVTVSGPSGTYVSYKDNISPGPATPGSITGNTHALCLVQESYSIPSVPGAVSYTWTAPTGATIISGQGTENVIIDFGSSFTGGDLTVTANSDCASSGMQSLSLFPYPLRVNYITGITEGLCPSGISSTTYHASPVSGATSYTWVVPAGVTIVAGQGTDTLAVTIDSTFTSGYLGVYANNSCGSSDSTQITLNSIPSVQAIYGQSSAVCSSNTPYVTYYVSPASGSTTYTWTSPAGTTITDGQGTGMITVFIDSTFSSGDISVTPSNFCGSGNEITLHLTSVPPQPGTTILGQTTNLCAPSVVYSYDVDTTSYTNYLESYTWTVPAGTTILSGQGTTHIEVTFDNTSMGGTLSVATTNACGSGPAISITLQAPTQTVTPGNIHGPKSGLCPSGISSAVYYVNPVAGTVNYTWTVPTGVTITSGQGNDTITVSIDSAFTSGNISVHTSGSCGDSPEKTALLRSVSGTPGAITGPRTELCAAGNSTVTYSINPVNGATSYTWAVPAGATILSGQGTDSVSVLFDSTFTSGNLTVTANNACGSSAVRSIALHSVPNTPGAITGQKTELCQSYSGTVHYSIAPVSGATSYTWTTPAGAFIGSGQGTDSVNVYFDSTFTSGNLTVIANNACGSSGVRSTLLRSVPVTPGAISGTKVGLCTSGISSQTYSVPAALGATSYTWTAPAGANIVNGQGTTSIDVYFDSTFTSGNLTVYASNGCGNSSARSTLLRSVTAAPAAISGPSSVCPSETGINFSVAAVSGASSYLWSVPASANITGGQGSNSITVNWGNSAGNVTVRAINDCGQSAQRSKHITIASCLRDGSIAASNSNPESEPEINVYPNPNNGTFMLLVNNMADQTITLTITNVLGKVIYSEKLSAVNEKEISLSGEAKGVYMLQISNADNSYYKKIVIQ